MRKSALKTVRISEVGDNNDSMESSLEKRKVKRASPSPRREGSVPDYLKRSSRWKKLQAMNEDLNAVSNSVYKFDDFLRKVSKKMKIKDLKTVKEEYYRLFKEEAERASPESLRQPALTPGRQGDESSLDMGTEADINLAMNAVDATATFPPQS
jgi:hypothetical protein